MEYNIKNAKVGDELILRSSRRSARVRVSRVGRKYLYVSRLDGGELRGKFHLDTGIEGSQYGSPSRLYTPAQWEDSEERDRLFRSLRAYGFVPDFSKYLPGEAPSTHKLRRLVAVLEERVDDDSHEEAIDPQQGPK